MKKLALTAASLQGLEIFANPRDILRDLFVYVDYLGGREIKRAVRTNELPAADLNRIARLLGEPAVTQQWIYFIDRLALRLGVIHYNTKGVYRGYSSSEPSFPDNYISLLKKEYDAFLDLPPVAQENKILKTLLDERKRSEFDSSNNEFYQQGILGRLDSFPTRGSATGVMPSLDFVVIRGFLLDLLQKCEPGIWYSAASLIAYLKAQHPFFIIPAKLPPDRWGHTDQRYSNFYDGPERWARDEAFVPVDAPDAFERVEGRYVERFLEGLPLVMRFVEVAYRPAKQQKVYPSLGFLTAFRVTESFIRLMQAEVHPPRVTVQPNFDVIVESEIYPARLMQTLMTLADEVVAPGGSAHAAVITLQLKKERIAAELVRNPSLDVAALLRELTRRDLPPNVATEIKEWSGHADQFTLYEGFDLLESAEALPQINDYLEESISPRFNLVRQAEDLVMTLEKAGLAPLWVNHDPIRFNPLPQETETVFPKKVVLPEKKSDPEPVYLKRTILITLDFSPYHQVFESFRRALAEARCPVQANAALYTITFPQQYQPKFDEVAQQLAAEYQLNIQDFIE